VAPGAGGGDGEAPREARADAGPERAGLREAAQKPERRTRAARRAGDLLPPDTRAPVLKPADHVSAARMRAQERMPLWKLSTSYFSLGLWIWSSSLPKPISIASMSRIDRK
jgi:hypothetical protein